MNKNYFLLGFIVSIIVFSIVTVGARVFDSASISFANGNLTNETTVKNAIDELYSFAELRYPLQTKQMTIDDTGIRFIGANPNNFICFKSSCSKTTMYRIIGIFKTNYTNDVSGEATDSSYLIKVVKNSSVTSRSYNTSYSNIWQNSALYTYLNSTFSSPTDRAVKSRWHLYGVNNYTATPHLYYERERNINNSGVLPKNGSAYYDAKIGLIYPSDYGLATSGDYTKANSSREECLSIALYGWNGGNARSYCAGNSWLYYNSATGSGLSNKGTTGNRWTITPFYNSSYEMVISSVGNVVNSYVNEKTPVYPVFYLNPDTEFLSGDGTFTNPFKIKENTITLDRANYSYTDGMTWSDWVNSSSNTYGFKLINNTLATSDNVTLYSVLGYGNKATDKIINRTSFVRSS